LKPWELNQGELQKTPSHLMPEEKVVFDLQYLRYAQVLDVDDEFAYMYSCVEGERYFDASGKELTFENML